MSVLECSRGNCPAIMCDRLIMGGRRYICEDCYAELQAAGQRWLASRVSASEIHTLVEQFLDSPVTGTAATAEAELERLIGRLEPF